MKKSYILDTSVLIDNPDCIEILRNGDENEILIPYSVILELDKLKRKSDLSFIISDIGAKIESDENINIIKNDNFEYSEDKLGDEAILRDIKSFIENKSNGVQDSHIVVSNDRFFRIRLGIEGVQAQELKNSLPFMTEAQVYTGFISEDEEKVPNCFEWIDGKPFFHSSTPRCVDHENKPWGVTPRTVYQNLAIELMLEPDIDIVTVISQAGYGKTFLALACAIDLVIMNKQNYEKLYIVKPNVEIGEKLGFLPGEVDEKLNPYFKPIEELILKLHDKRPANRFFMETTPGKFKLDPKKCEILPINFLRGMNLENCVVIIDEAQNLTRLQTRTLLTRMGHDVKCFVLGDINQVDHPYLNRYNNGLNWIVKKFKGFHNYGHIVLKGAKSRGPITDMTLSTNL